MTESAPYVKFMRSEVTDELMKQPNSFALLALIAQRARREVPVFNPYALQIGEAMIGDHGAVGLTRQQFRTALANLQKWDLITIRPTNKGTIAKLSNTKVYDINAPTVQPSNQPTNNHQPNQTPTTNKNDKKKEEKKESSAAHAATPPSSLLVEGSKKSTSAGRKKKEVAQADEVAALPLPFDGSGFVACWATFRTGPKQAKKPVSAFALMLTKLGKYPEAFAVEMLEAAIQGDWSGVENPGTAGKYKDWQAQHPAPRPTASTMGPGFSVNALFGLTPPPVPLASHLDPDAMANNAAREADNMQQRIDARKQSQAAAESSEPSDTP